MTVPHETGPTLTAGLISDDGATCGHREALALAHLRLLFSGTSGVVEVRSRAIVSGRWSQQFFPAANLPAVAERALRLAVDREVYVGVLPRSRPGGTRRDLGPDGATVWADLDSAAAASRARAHIPAPSLLLRSGGLGHAHAYWALDRALSIPQIEAINQALARQFGADEASTDAPRILRLAGTLAHKYDPPVVIAPVHDPAPAEFAGSETPCGGREGRRRPEGRNRRLPSAAFVRLLGGEPESRDSPHRSTSFAPPCAPANERRPDSGNVVPKRQAATAELHRRLELLEPAVYVRTLTGLEAGRGGKVRCPLHDDRTPSLHVYPTAEQGWFCFGCRRGGSVYDLAGALWNRPLRGPGFLDLRDDLVALLLPDRSQT